MLAASNPRDGFWYQHGGKMSQTTDTEKQRGVSLFSCLLKAIMEANIILTQVCAIFYSQGGMLWNRF